MSYLKVQLANYKKYEEGELIFKWLELPATDKEIQETFDKIGVTENIPYEGYFIKDYKTDILGWKIEEEESLEYLNEIMEQVGCFQYDEIEIIDLIYEIDGINLEQAVEKYKKGRFIYHRGIKSYEELAEMLVNKGHFGNVPENLKSYIDYKAIVRDLKSEYIQTTTGFFTTYE